MILFDQAHRAAVAADRSLFRRAAPVAAVAIAALSSACSGDTRRSIGLERTPPDEFSVVTRAPLQIPPDFGLRPPAPGTERPNEATAKQQAQAAVFGGSAKTPATDLGDRSPGEAALLKQAGALAADPAIRQEVDRENLQLADEEQSFADQLIFWRADQPSGAPVVDAQAEAQRLQQNAALGKPATAGDTPTIRRGDAGGLFNGLF